MLSLDTRRFHKLFWRAVECRAVSCGLRPGVGERDWDDTCGMTLRVHTCPVMRGAARSEPWSPIPGCHEATGEHGRATYSALLAIREGMRG